MGVLKPAHPGPCQALLGATISPHSTGLPSSWTEAVSLVCLSLMDSLHIPGAPFSFLYLQNEVFGPDSKPPPHFPSLEVGILC